MALLALPLMTAPSLAQTPCTITVVNVWSDDREKTFDTANNTLSVEEGAYWEFDLEYSCTGLQDGESPAVSITKPSETRFDTDDFRGGISEVDGVADGDALTGACLTATGCRIEIFGTSKDNNCRNVDATVQRMQAQTQVKNTDSGGALNLSDLLTVTIEAKDDDTIPQETLNRYRGMGRILNQKPTC